jgi:serine/threonine-protein kinase
VQQAYRGPGPPPAYYDYDERPRRRRPWWPWVLALLFLVGAGIGGYLLYDQIQEQLAASEPVPVPLLEGKRESLAVQELIADGLPFDVVRQPHATEEEGFVYDQDPEQGERINPQTDKVTIYVSTGKPQVTVPDVRGKSEADAVAALTAAKLTYNIHNINSDRPQNTVIAQDPKPGERVVQGTSVRINVSAGPKPVAVPNVVGLSYESAASTIQAAGLGVARQDADSDEPAGVVIDQDPQPGTSVAPRSTVTVTVSSGPDVVEVPNVVDSDEATAIQLLQDAGLAADLQEQPVENQDLDGIVLDQSPLGGEEVEPGSTITIVVGRFQEPSDDQESQQ